MRSYPVEAVRELGDLSAVRGALIGSVCGGVLWMLFGLVFVMVRLAI